MGLISYFMCNNHSTSQHANSPPKGVFGRQKHPLRGCLRNLYSLTSLAMRTPPEIANTPWLQFLYNTPISSVQWRSFWEPLEVGSVFRPAAGRRKRQSRVNASQPTTIVIRDAASMGNSDKGTIPRSRRSRLSVRLRVPSLSAPSKSSRTLGGWSLAVGGSVDVSQC